MRSPAVWRGLASLAVLACLLVAVTVVRLRQQDDPSVLVQSIHSAGKTGSYGIVTPSHGSQLADLIDSPLVLAKEKIDNMLSIDEPTEIRIKPDQGKPDMVKGKKVRCTTLACGAGGYENDYLAEAERRWGDNCPDCGDGPKGSSDSGPSISSLISALQSKLANMKDEFRMIRARYCARAAHPLHRMLTFALIVCIERGLFHVGCSLE